MSHEQRSPIHVRLQPCPEYPATGCRPASHNLSRACAELRSAGPESGGAPSQAPAVGEQEPVERPGEASWRATHRPVERHPPRPLWTGVARFGSSTCTSPAISLSLSGSVVAASSQRQRRRRRRPGGTLPECSDFPSRQPSQPRQPIRFRCRTNPTCSATSLSFPQFHCCRSVQCGSRRSQELAL
jgi:hypothetical protein